MGQFSLRDSGGAVEVSVYRGLLTGTRDLPATFFPGDYNPPTFRGALQGPPAFDAAAPGSEMFMQLRSPARLVFVGESRTSPLNASRGFLFNMEPDS